MGPDDRICYCNRVSYRKLMNYARREQPKKASQMSECLGAGTGCGWCIPTLKRIHEAAVAGEGVEPEITMSPEEYAAARQDYIRNKKPKNRF